MSRLEELIAQHCPEGVEYKTLGEIATIIRGNGLQKKDFTTTGVGCIHYGQIYTYYGAYAETTKSFVSSALADKLQKVHPGDLVVAVTSENVEDVCKCVAWLGKEDIVTGGHAAIIRHQQDPKYLSYYFQTADFFEQKRKLAAGTKVIDVQPQKLARILIPLPPLPVQREIVRILDHFSELTAELAVELAAELAARQKQYEYYLKAVVHNQADAKYEKLGTLGQWIGGGTPSTTKKAYWENGTIPWITSKDMIGSILISTQNRITIEAIHNSSAKLIPKDFVALVVRSGILRHTLPIVYVPFEATVNQDIRALIPKAGISAHYIAYALHAFHNELLTHTRNSGGTVESIVFSKLLDFSIPIPPLSIQLETVAILDRFDTLCNDLTAGLPAEIEARRKQYEYYRDKLMTFKEGPT